MGQNMHVHLEIRMGGQWHHYSYHDGPRWYAYWIEMCERWSRIVIPYDVTEVTKHALANADGELCGWWSSADLGDMFTWDCIADNGADLRADRNSNLFWMGEVLGDPVWLLSDPDFDHAETIGADDWRVIYIIE